MQIIYDQSSYKGLILFSFFQSITQYQQKI